MAQGAESVRAVAITGPAAAGKTTLLEALLFASGAVPRQGDVAAGASIGDSSPEARHRGQSVELNLAGIEFLGDRFSLVDCPGSSDFGSMADNVLPAVDLVVVVVDPQPAKAILAQPILKTLERLNIPHAIFVNKIEQARDRLDELLQALQAASGLPVVARQIPLYDGERINGFIDLALERGFIYRPGQPSARVDLTEENAAEEAEARFHMLEQLADYDDVLLEKLLSDIEPTPEEVFGDLAAELREDKIVPVFLGSALNGFGIRRLLKALRHEAPSSEAAAQRIGADGPSAYVFAVSHAGQAGKLALARVLGGGLQDGADLRLADGGHHRAGGILAINGGSTKKVPAALPGEIVAVAKIDEAVSGDLLSADGRSRPARREAKRAPLFAQGIQAKERKDDVRLAAALTKLLEEDTSLSVRRDPVTLQTLLEGQGPTHLETTMDRLKRRFGLDVVSARPTVAYRESIRKPVTQHGRHKKQSGGHGQFGDVLVEIKPGARGSGFTFSQRITGGAVPKQWIPAVEQGLKDAMERGPLGFPVVDVEAVLIDGGYHSVDSSEMSFRAAGRLAMSEGLRQCAPYLLEPIEKLVISAPSSSTPKITAAVAARRGQILGFEPKADWPNWDVIEAYMPEEHRQDFILELRGLTQGLGSFEAAFDHMAELTGRLADDVVARQSKTVKA